MAAGLGLGLRTLRRLAGEGLIRPTQPGQGRRAALWDPVGVARAILARRADDNPRDRRELAQARLLELRYRREAREVLDRDDVVRRGQAVAKAVAAHVLALPSALVKAGVLAPEGEAAADRYIRDRLDELARLEDPHYLAGDA